MNEDKEKGVISMKKELQDEELQAVSGGKVYVNGNTRRVGFTTIKGVFTLKDGVSPYQVLEACDAKIGQYPTDAEYDKACYDMMVSKGWI